MMKYISFRHEVSLKEGTDTIHKGQCTVFFYYK